MKTKAELVAAVAAASGLAKGNVETVLDAFRSVLQTEVSKGQDVRWPGVGDFQRVKRAATNRKSPFNGQMMAIPERHTVKFVLSETLKGAVRSGE